MNPREEERLTPGTASLRHPILTIMPAVLLVIAALVFSASRTPTFTAEARPLVGSADVRAQALPGYVTATAKLAEYYSRLASTQPVLRSAAQELGVTPRALASHMAATPVPDAPFVRIITDASSRRQARAMADAVSNSLSRYVDSISRGAQGDLLQRYTAFADAEQRAVLEQDRLRVELGELRSGNSTAEREDRIRRAESDLVAAASRAATARLQQTALASAYTAQLQAADAPQRLRSTGPASVTGSDASSFRQKIVGSAVVAGLLLGLLAATLTEHRRRRRSNRATTVTSSL